MKKVIFIFTIILLYSCNSGTAPEKNNGKSVQNKPKSFNMPEIPSMLSSNEQISSYVAEHYWDNFDFTDTTYINLPNITEQAFADYINIMNAIPLTMGISSINKTMAKAETNRAMFTHFIELFEKYLHEPNSPMRNEELHIPVLNYIIESDSVLDIDKIRPNALLEMALKNRMGNIASDFTITLKSGKTVKLYDIKADYTLLYFYNPDCHACAELIAGIKISGLLSPLIKSGKLKIFAVYPDADLEAWHNHIAEIPQEWTNGYDAAQVLNNEKSYDLKAIPTIYLLDKDKKVLIKDAAAVQPIEAYMMSI